MITKLVVPISLLLFTGTVILQKSLLVCPRNPCQNVTCEPISCGPHEEYVKNGGYCGCCDECYRILGKFGNGKCVET